MKLFSAVLLLSLLSLSNAKEEPLKAGVRGSVTTKEFDSSVSYNFKDGLTHTLSGSEVDGELCDPFSKSVSGYMDITGSKYDDKGADKHFFYWFFEKRIKSLGPDFESPDSAEYDKKTPFIVWLTGGPGCSSSLALLTENGPCSVNKDGATTKQNPNSWTEAANVLWLDQPAGVGFSYGKENDSNEEMIGEDAYFFLQAFFKANPKYQENPVYIVGESYGGHYAPAIAHKIFLENKNLQKDMIRLNLSGLAVGNGLTNPEEQYKWYADMAFKNSHGIKVVGEETYKMMKAGAGPCGELAHACNSGATFIEKMACQTAFIECNMAETAPYRLTGLNPYDIRKKCEVQPLCYDFSHIQKWMNSDATRKALHVTNKSGEWASCNMGINGKFHVDWMKDFSGYVADMLNAGIPALIYAGDVDFICNYLGNKAWTSKLDWDHGKCFRSAEDHVWGKGKDGKGAGMAKTANGFTFLQVFDAGHMVPADQPEVALSMIQNFITGGTF